MTVRLRTPQAPTVPHKGQRTLLGALIGAVPGIALMVVNVVFISGEATLSVGVGAIFLAVGGAVVGAVLGSQGGPTGRTIVGAFAGSLFGVIAFFTPGFAILSPLILIGAAIAGGLIAGQSPSGAPPPAPPPPPPPPPGTTQP